MKFISKISSCLFGLFLLLFAAPAYAGTIDGNNDSLIFIYVDNSRLNVNDGLTSSQIKQLIALNDSFISAENCKYFLFGSNGNRPFISSNAPASSEYIKKLYSTQSSFPNINEDLLKIRESLFQIPFSIEKKLNLYFFLTDNLCSSGNFEISKFFCSLSREIDMMTDFSGDISVTVYYSNQTKKVLVNDVEKNMCFYNGKAEMKPKVHFDLVKLQ